MKNILACIADVVFPPRCISCDKALDSDKDNHFCQSCYSQLNFIRPPVCPKCGLPFPDDQQDHLCGGCLEDEPPFSAARAVGRYEKSLLNSIHRFKYREDLGTGRELGSLMAKFAFHSFNIQDFSLIVPVPLHINRLRERGFNQSLILARALSKKFRLPVDFDSLKRRMPTASQVSLGRAARKMNVKGAFHLADAAAVKDEKIILIDDVFTTGSTVRECASVLMEGQAKEVAVITLARAV